MPRDRMGDTGGLAVSERRDNHRYYSRNELDQKNPDVIAGRLSHTIAACMHARHATPLLPPAATPGMDPKVLTELRTDCYRFLRRLGESLQLKFDSEPYVVATASVMTQRVFRRR